MNTAVPAADSVELEALVSDLNVGSLSLGTGGTRRARRVAEELRVSPSTVRNHVAGVYKKLEVHSRAEVRVWAKRHRVVGWRS